jgi:hypothetical protein
VLPLDAPNELISEYPLVLVAVFGVPLADLLHVASLVKLARDAVRRPVLSGALTVSTAKIWAAACRAPIS